MQIEQTTHGAVTVIRPVGALTVEHSDALARRLEEAREKSMGGLVIDASAVPFVDSRALEVLLDASEALAGTGRCLKLSGLNPVLREVLQLTDLAASFEQYSDVNSAVRSFL